LRVPDVELDEGAGQLLDLPGRGRLARAQPDNRIADSHRLPRLENQVARHAVALVEEAEHRHPLRHRRRAGRDRRDGLRDVHRPRLAGRLAVAARLVFGAAIAAAERGEGDEGGAERKPHARSGVQAS
jgi:hypothetical protein